MTQAAVRRVRRPRWRSLAARTNLVSNPSFETNTTGWTTGGTNTIAASLLQRWAGVKSLLCTYVDNLVLASFTITLTAAAHVATVYLWIPEEYNGSQVTVNAGGFTSATGTITADANMDIRNEWQRVTVGPFTPDGGDLAGNINVAEEVAATVSPFIYIDGAQVELASAASPYLDGSLGEGYSWDSTAHGSISTRAAGTQEFGEGRRAWEVRGAPGTDSP